MGACASRWLIQKETLILLFNDMYVLRIAVVVFFPLILAVERQISMLLIDKSETELTGSILKKDPKHTRD